MPGTILDRINFDDSLGTLPRRPSFWLDDLFFWTPIVLEASGQEHLPHGFGVHVTPGWGGDVTYDKKENLVSIPIGVACGLYNQYVQEMEIKSSAATATEIEPEGFYSLWQLYHNWDIDKGPWIEKVIFTALIQYKFQGMVDFFVSSLDRSELFAGEFLDAVLQLTDSEPKISDDKKSAIRAAIMEEPSLVADRASRNVSYDFFVSHASEDKNDFVRPLVQELEKRGIKVWYDEFTLKVGDSLRRSIDQGLANSRYGIVVLSNSFFAKNWPQYELDGLVAREMDGRKVILPIWHKVTKDEVCSYSPSLADKVALNSSNQSLEDIACGLEDVLRS